MNEADEQAYDLMQSLSDEELWRMSSDGELDLDSWTINFYLTLNDDNSTLVSIYIPLTNDELLQSLADYQGIPADEFIEQVDNETITDDELFRLAYDYSDKLDEEYFFKYIRLAIDDKTFGVIDD